MARNGNGLITTKQAEAAGISRVTLKKYVDSGKITYIRKGLYILQNDLVDEYALIQARSSKVIFSYGTALYLWGMTDRTPHIIDITAPHGHNLTRIFKEPSNLRFHYVVKSYYEIGITETRSPQGSNVKLYDKERCICDLIRRKNFQDMQLYSQAIQLYFQNRPNLRKLLKYGKLFGIEEQIRTYMEVLT